MSFKEERRAGGLWPPSPSAGAHSPAPWSHSGAVAPHHHFPILLTVTFSLLCVPLVYSLTWLINYNPCLKNDTIYWSHFRCHSMGPRATRDIEGSRPSSCWTLGSRQFAVRLLSKYDHSLMKLKAGSDFSQQQGRWPAGRTLGWGFLPRGGPALAVSPGPSTPEAVASPEVAAAISLQDKRCHGNCCD